MIPEATKNSVLESLCQSGLNFECVADLCEMSARKDSRLKDFMEGGGTMKVAACYPRAVKWLFHHAGAPLPEDDSIQILNMRETGADEISKALLQDP